MQPGPGAFKENWDPRFFFSEWDDELIGRLLKQQEELLGSGQQREVLIILDDVILSSKADDQLAHMAMRGRHFRISLMMCAVSYTTLPKRTRRSLDVLLVYSLPMQGDFKVLTYEYCQGSSSMARFALNQLREHNASSSRLCARNSRCSSGRPSSTNSRKQKLHRTPTNREHRTKPTLSWNVHRIFIKKELLPLKIVVNIRETPNGYTWYEVDHALFLLCRKMAQEVAKQFGLTSDRGVSYAGHK